MVLLVLAATVLVVFVLRLSNKVAIVLALASMCFLPVWAGASVGGIFIPAGCAVCLLASATFLPSRFLHIRAMDGIVLILLLVSVLSLFLGNGSVALSSLTRFLLYFLVGYVLGRLAGVNLDRHWLFSLIAILFTVVAVLAVIESITRWNPFVELRFPNREFAQWSGIRVRGGLPRAEGAFGQSIALGSCLAMAIPIAIASPFKSWVRATMVATMLAGIVLTFSRVSLIGAALSLLLSIVFLNGVLSARAKGTIVVLASTVAVVIFPSVSAVFDDAGTEASGSAAYRGDLVSLISRMKLIGVTDAAHRSPTGVLYFGDFRSIDSQLIVTGLTSGTLALGAVIVSLFVAMAVVLSGRANPVTIAVVAQIPAFATVALITQYSLFTWFIIGLATTVGRPFTAGESPLGVETERHPRALGPRAAGALSPP